MGRAGFNGVGVADFHLDALGHHRAFEDVAELGFFVMVDPADIAGVEFEGGDHSAVSGAERFHGDAFTQHLPVHCLAISEGPTCWCCAHWTTVAHRMWSLPGLAVWAGGLGWE